MDAIMKSQKFQNLLEKFVPNKKGANDRRDKAKNPVAVESNRRDKEESRKKTKEVPPPLDVTGSLRKSRRDVRKPQRYDPSPKVTGSRVLERSKAEPKPRPMKPATSLQRKNPEGDDDDEEEDFMSASMVGPKSPPHRSAFSRVTKPKPLDPRDGVEHDGRRMGTERNYVPRINYPEQVDSYREERGYGNNEFARPHPPQYPRWQDNPSCSHQCERQPFVKLQDISRSRPDLLYSSSLIDAPQAAHGSGWVNPPRRGLSSTMRLTEMKQNRNDSLWAAPSSRPDIHSANMRLTDLALSRNDSIWAAPPRPARRDDGFLRPATPPNAFEILAKQEQSQYLDVYEEFACCPFLSTIEVIHVQSKIAEKVEIKIAKSVQHNQTVQSILRGVGDTTGANGKEAMIQSWLGANTSVAQLKNIKRNVPDFQEVEAKRRRLANVENQMPRNIGGGLPRETTAPSRFEISKNSSYSVLKRREDRRRLDRSTPTNHLAS